MAPWCEYAQVHREKHFLYQTEADIVALRILGRKAAQRQLSLMRPKVRSLGRLREIGEVDVAEKRNRQSDYTVDDERLELGERDR